MSKPSRKPKPLRCPLNKEQQQQVKKIADTVDKHKRIIRKLSPL